VKSTQRANSETELFFRTPREVLSALTAIADCRLRLLGIGHGALQWSTGAADILEYRVALDFVMCHVTAGEAVALCDTTTGEAVALYDTTIGEAVALCD
jgi:hypothetical protein